jgi:hypothetical protein
LLGFSCLGFSCAGKSLLGFSFLLLFSFKFTLSFTLGVSVGFSWGLLGVSVGFSWGLFFGLHHLFQCTAHFFQFSRFLIFASNCGLISPQIISATPFNFGSFQNKENSVIAS